MPSAYNPDTKTEMDSILLAMPGVTDGKAFGYPAYKIGGKVFVFVGADGIAVKLPAQRVQALIASGDAAMSAFEPVEGRVWKEWLSIDRESAEDYQQDTTLFEESIAFVSA